MRCYSLISGPLALVLAIQAAAAPPATVAQAAAKLDLVTLPLPDGAVMPGYRRDADLGYMTKLAPRAAFDFVHKQLAARGWKTLGDVQDYGEVVGADYANDGFVAHVSVIPAQEGKSSVTIRHKGNVPVTELPIPDNVEKMYAFTGTVMYRSPDAVGAAVEACRKKMLAAGWTPHGFAGDTRYYRQNAVQADVRVMAAPGQGGATVISLSTKLLSLELPAPDFADDYRYSDGTTDILYDCDKTAVEAPDYYREVLAPLGWQATLDKPLEDRWKKFTIFRNAAQEMITVTTHDFEGRTRVKLNHQNVAEVANDEFLLLSAAGEKAKYRDNEWLPLQVRTPSGATRKQEDDWAVQFSAPRGQAFVMAQALVAQFEAAGWKSDGKKDDAPHLRSTRLEGQDRVLHVVALDPPRRDAWVAVIGVGGVKLLE